MHILDGFIDGRTAVVSGAIAATGVAVALRQARTHMPPRRVPLMGVSAAFIFAVQMLNFPVVGGTSGHLVGGVLAAVLLGPSAAIVVMTAVLTVQCFVFLDGGATALGANVFNMGIINAGGGYFLYRLLARLVPGRIGQLAAVAIASWCVTVLAAVACAGELALSGTAPWRLALPAMAGVHMLIGIGEAAITTLIVLAIMRTRPELIEGRDALRPRNGRGIELVVFGILIALGLALFVSPLACAWPDGLDRFAARNGLKGYALLVSPLKDYRFPGVQSVAMSTAIAAAIGTITLLILGFNLSAPVDAAQGRGAADTLTQAMHEHAHEYGAPPESAIHRLPAGWKMGAAAALLGGVLAMPRSAWWALVPVAAALLLLIPLAALPWWTVMRRVLIVEPLALGMAGLAFLQPHGAAIFWWLIARTTVCLLAMVLLALTTPFSDELGVLRRLRVPALMVTTVALMHRYLYVVQEESLRMRACACRSPGSANGIAWRGRIWLLQAGVAGQLFLRTLDRAERVYIAMTARGWK